MKTYTRMRRERLARDMTQEEIADIVGCTQNSISRYELLLSQPGKRGQLRKRLEGFYGLKLAELQEQVEADL